MGLCARQTMKGVTRRHSKTETGNWGVVKRRGTQSNEDGGMGRPNTRMVTLKSNPRELASSSWGILPRMGKPMDPGEEGNKSEVSCLWDGSRGRLLAGKVFK